MVERCPRSQLEVVPPEGVHNVTVGMCDVLLCNFWFPKTLSRATKIDVACREGFSRVCWAIFAHHCRRRHTFSSVDCIAKSLAAGDLAQVKQTARRRRRYVMSSSSLSSSVATAHRARCHRRRRLVIRHRSRSCCRNIRWSSGCRGSPQGVCMRCNVWVVLEAAWVVLRRPKGP
jgi:hypothetical protein